MHTAEELQNAIAQSAKEVFDCGECGHKDAHLRTLSGLLNLADLYESHGASGQPMRDLVEGALRELGLLR